MTYEEYLALADALTPVATEPPPVRCSYLCLVCEVVEENLTVNPVRCWSCGSEDLLPGYTPRFYNASHGTPDLF